MSTPPHLLVDVVHDEIIPTKDDSAAAFTACEFLEAAWWLANNKAKQLGWIV
jgi:hypothetical protein